MAQIDEILLTDIAHKSDFLKTATGDLDIISGLENVKDALFRRLVTTPGTLIHRPNYGVGIERFQNAPNTLGNQRLIANRIQEQFEQDPRVEAVTGVRVEVGDLTPEKTIITIRVKIRGYDELALTFIPFGEGV
jgi:phage baseplate assembly protein W